LKRKTKKKREKERKREKKRELWLLCLVALAATVVAFTVYARPAVVS